MATNPTEMFKGKVDEELEKLKTTSEDAQEQDVHDDNVEEQADGENSSTNESNETDALAALHEKLESLSSQNNKLLNMIKSEAGRRKKLEDQIIEERNQKKVQDTTPQSPISLSSNQIAAIRARLTPEQNESYDDDYLNVMAATSGVLVNDYIQPLQQKSQEVEQKVNNVNHEIRQTRLSDLVPDYNNYRETDRFNDWLEDNLLGYSYDYAADIGDVNTLAGIYNKYKATLNGAKQTPKKSNIAKSKDISDMATPLPNNARQIPTESKNTKTIEEIQQQARDQWVKQNKYGTAKDNTLSILEAMKKATATV